MRTDLTDLTIVLDRSGSMESIRTDMEGAMASFLGEQRAAPGELIVSFTRFDSEIEHVFDALPIASVRPIALKPRNSTALLDAVGLTILRTGKRLAAMREADRPGKVIVVVVTDGMENASQRFTWEAVRAQIEHQKSTYAWQFIFLGANFDAVAAAANLGIDRGDALTFDVDPRKLKAAMSAMSRGVMSKRASVAAAPAFSQADRDEQDS